MSLTGERVEAFCLSLPGTTLTVQWVDARVLKVGGKMFAVLRPDLRLSFKCSEIAYHMLTLRPGIAPAPYLARAGWVQLDGLATLEEEDLLDYLRLAYGLVLQKLPKAARERLTAELEGNARRRPLGVAAANDRENAGMNETERAAQRVKAERFRALHEAEAAFVIPNPWDIGSARLLAELGFEALATTSAGFAFTLGRRDGAVTRDEALGHAAAIVAATELPVSADLENGFGDAPEDAALTIRRAIEVGLAGASIEDASGDPARPIYDHEHSVERVAAAVEAARGAPVPFMLTARAENFLHGRADLDDTLKRLQAYEAAGADVLYAPGLPDLEAVRLVCDAVSRPVNVLATPNFTVADLEEAGVARISLGGTFARVAVHAFLQAARVIKDKGSFAFADNVPPFSAMTRGFPDRERP